MSKPNHYVRSENNVLVPMNIEGVDIVYALGLNIDVEEAAGNIAAVSALSSNFESLSNALDENLSDVEALCAQLNSLSNNSLESNIDSLSSDVSGISSNIASIKEDLKSIGDVQILEGTTGGKVYYTQNQIGKQKKIIINFEDYQNDTDVNQEITFPVPFIYLPIATSNVNGISFTITLDTLTILTPNSTTAFSGTIVVDGQ